MVLNLSSKKAMIGYLLILLLIATALSEPDLCGNPKLDSITYISGKTMWFFTSGGFYWYIKEKDFPPGAPTGKLPEGFTRGDAAFYCDWIKICMDAPLARQRVKNRAKINDQLIVLVEKGNDGNKIIEFDARMGSWSKSQEWDNNRMIGRSNIEDTKAEIDAIFTIRDSEVFIVQKQKYAAVDLKPLCQDPTGWAKQFASRSVDSLENSLNVPFDAIAVKDDYMYSFIGSKFWVSKVENFKSRDGKIVISKGSQQNVSSKFFKFKECAKRNDNSQQPTETIKPQNVVPDREDDQKVDEYKEEMGEERAEQAQSENEGSSSGDDSDSSGGSGYLIVIIVVIVVVVVALAIGITAFALRGKTDQVETKKGGAQPLKSKAVTSNKPMTSKAPSKVSTKK